jgi:hypothetical protein
MYWFVFLFWIGRFRTVSHIGGSFSTKENPGNPTGFMVENAPIAKPLLIHLVLPMPHT